MVTCAEYGFTLGLSGESAAVITFESRPAALLGVSPLTFSMCVFQKPTQYHKNCPQMPQCHSNRFYNVGRERDPSHEVATVVSARPGTPTPLGHTGQIAGDVSISMSQGVAGGGGGGITADDSRKVRMTLRRL